MTRSHGSHASHASLTRKLSKLVVTVDDPYCFKFLRMCRRAGSPWFAGFLFWLWPETVFLQFWPKEMRSLGTIIFFKILFLKFYLYITHYILILYITCKTVFNYRTLTTKLHNYNVYRIKMNDKIRSKKVKERNFI